MSTRSEIRFFKHGKQTDCVYHHSDGYPEHVIEDIAQISYYDETYKTLMRALAKNHGTVDVECSGGKKTKKYQGDIEYSYELEFGKKKDSFGLPKSEIIKIYKHGNNVENKKLVFEGTISKAYEKYVCKDRVKG